MVDFNCFLIYNAKGDFMIRKYIGDKAFYKKVLALTLPIMLQNGITNLVNMLDNIMVGRLDIASSSGVTVTNQLIFVFNLCIFGAISGAGIFGAQFFGKGDNNGVRHTFRFKLIISLILSVLAVVLFIVAGKPLINLYLQGESGNVDPVITLKEARDYLNVMLIGLVPFALSQCYSGTLRECGRPVLPMVAGSIAVVTNLAFNYILIFGHFGAPALGVKGAAIATVVSRYVELVIIIIWTRMTAKNSPFIIGVYRSLYVPANLVKEIIKKGMPLMLNEALWSMGIATVNQCYSARGIEVVAANNILQTFFNVFSVAFMAVGVAIGILLGQQLGAKDEKGAMDTCRKLIMFSVLVSVIVGIVFFVCAIFIPKAYNYPDEVRDTATKLMQICAIVMPIDAFAHATYFTLRSGGKTLITFVFDSGFMWLVSVPVAFVLSNFTSLNILWLYAIVQLINLIKCIIGYIFVKKGVWIRNIVSNE